MSQTEPNIPEDSFKEEIIEEMVTCSATDSFKQWLSQANGSLIVTSHQANKVLLIGWDGRQITLLARQFDHPRGLAVQGKKLVLATHYEVVVFADASLLAPDYLPDQPGRYDALYLPRLAYFAGDLKIRDLSYAGNELWAVCSQFDCLATLDAEYNFTPRWKPPFISEIAPEDRCHLNGLAVVNGKPKYVIAMNETDTPKGWAPGRATGGVILDMDSNEVIVRGLATPHSPRWYNNQLWFLNAGTGELWTVDPKNCRGEAVCALPGYARGLCFVGPFALVGLGHIRERHRMFNYPVQQRGDKLMCGIAVVDLRSGQIVGRLEFLTGCRELYDIRFLPGVRRPMLLNLEREDRRFAFTAPEFSYWLRPAESKK